MSRVKVKSVGHMYVFSVLLIQSFMYHILSHNASLWFSEEINTADHEEQQQRLIQAWHNEASILWRSKGQSQYVSLKESSLSVFQSSRILSSRVHQVFHSQCNYRLVD